MSKLKDIIKSEYQRCSTDYVHAMKKYCTIVHPIKGKIKFNLYEFQEKTLNEFQKHRFNIILKSRQMGISTLVASYAALEMIFKPDYNVLLIATNQSIAINLLKKIKVVFDSLPAWLKPKIKVNNELSLILENGSIVKAVAATPEASRSEALSLLIFDEMAFAKQADEIWTSAQLTLATGGSAILLSTPKGIGNCFHRLYQQADNGEAPLGLELFNPIKLPWYLHPDRDQKWRDQQTLTLGEKMANQECNCDFLASGDTMIDTEILKYYENNTISDPLEKRWEGSLLWVWSHPKPSGNYSVIVDPARGDGSDETAIEVIDNDTLEQVAEYLGYIDTREAGRRAVALAHEYNNALLTIENKNVGWDTVQEVINIGYNNLYYSFKNADMYIDPIKHIKRNYDLKDKEDMIPGFSTDTKNRPLIISKLEINLRGKHVIIKSIRLLNQLKTFNWINGKAQALVGYHDDAIMALGIGLYVRDTALRLKEIGISLTEKTLNHISKTRGINSISRGDNNPFSAYHKSQIDTKWLF